MYHVLLMDYTRKEVQISHYVEQLRALQGPDDGPPKHEPDNGEQSSSDALEQTNESQLPRQLHINKLQSVSLTVIDRILQQFRILLPMIL